MDRKEPAGVPTRAFPIGGLEEVFNLDPKSPDLRGGASFIARSGAVDQLGHSPQSASSSLQSTKRTAAKR